MPRIFISYRREDSEDAVGRLYDRLSAHFGAESVFMDVDTIPIGVDFRAHLQEWVARADLLVVAIGSDWLDVTNEAGARRLDDPADFVRIEIEAGLARGIPVVPVLVGRGRMPGRAELPEAIAELAYRQAAEVRSGRDFNDHVARLIRGIEGLACQMPERLRLLTARAVEPAAGEGQDALGVFEVGDDGQALVIAVADGAGGVSGGREAARAIVDAAGAAATRLAGAAAADFFSLLRELDARLAADRDAGESTAVVLSVTSEGIVGASVGDSGAWLVGRRGCLRLTDKQRRKPLLGSGEAEPICFQCPACDALDATLLVATDGLFDYAAGERILDVARGGDLEAAARGLVELVRLRSGALQDDVGLVLCRPGV